MFYGQDADNQNLLSNQVFTYHLSCSKNLALYILNVLIRKQKEDKGTIQQC